MLAANREAPEALPLPPPAVLSAVLVELPTPAATLLPELELELAADEVADEVAAATALLDAVPLLPDVPEAPPDDPLPPPK